MSRVAFAAGRFVELQNDSPFFLPPTAISVKRRRLPKVGLSDSGAKSTSGSGQLVMEDYLSVPDAQNGHGDAITENMSDPYDFMMLDGVGGFCSVQRIRMSPQALYKR